MAVKPNKENIVSDILNELSKGTTYTECIKVILAKFSLSSPTFDKYWKEANERHSETQQAAQKAIHEQTISTMTEAAKSGLKSKIERTLEKQKDIQLLRDSVESGITDDYYIADGQYITYQRPLTILEKATILKRASEIESEISKIEADYAPMKTANTDSEGNDAPSSIIIVNSVPEMKELEG